VRDPLQTFCLIDSATARQLHFGTHAITESNHTT
jgi:hypothetical protein